MKIQQNQINWLVAASTFAVIALLLLQVQWIWHSKGLIEEQFNNKVTMALCMAVTDLGDGPVGCIPSGQATTNEKKPMAAVLNDVFNPPKNNLSRSSIRNSITESLAFYNIHIPFEIEMVDEKKTCRDVNKPGCCSMQAVAGFEDYLLNISFPGKTNYIFKQLGLMLLASILLLLFVTMVFYKANQYLIRQKIIGEQNKDFFNNMAHEFKTPLTNIKLASNLLTKKNASLGSNNYMDIIKKESDKLMNQVERVLHLAGLEKGETALSLENINVHTLFEEVAAPLRFRIKEKGGNIKIDVPENLTLVGDRFHLGNAFRNLIENAIKYAEENPEILITSRKSENHVILLFKDNGVGIAKENQELIFEQFKRVNTRDVHNVKGFGLGLAYVKSVMELHKGFITVLSDIHKGSRFNLHFPYGRNA